MNADDRTRHTPAPGLHQVPLTSGGAASGESFELYPGQRLGAFELVQLLGKGGMGQVFLAEQLYPVQRQVALKFMQGRLTDASAAARFEIERQALARMSHPAIAQVYEAGATADGFPYLSMEYVPGEPLDLCSERLALSLRARIELYVRVCLGVQHAHNRGILHLDLKPGNVLLAEVDGLPQPKIIDFGLATSAKRAPGKRASGSMAGTRGYMSPEQMGIDLDGGDTDIDARSDVYALGVMLYELICQARPFAVAASGSNDIDRLRCEYERLRPSPPSEVLRSRGRTAEAAMTSGDLDAIVARSMAVKRSARYASVSELIEDLRAFLEYRPVRAREASRWHRLTLGVRRNRMSAVIAGAVLATLLTGLGSATYGLFEARRERDIAAARQSELERVTDFQRRMLASADPATLGQRLRLSLSEQYAKAAPDRSAAFERELALANPTEAARRLLDQELLARGLQTIERDLGDQPRVAVELLQSIAESYAGLGQHDRALAIVGDAKARWQALGGDPAKALRLNLQSFNYRKQLGQLSVADVDAFLRDAQSAADAKVGLQAQLLRAEIDGLNAGNLDASIATVRTLLPEFERSFGRDTDESISATQVLALLLTRRGDHDAALPVWEDLLARLGAARGEDDLLRVGTLEQLSINHGLRGELDSALRLNDEVLALRRRLQGNEHPATLNALSAKAVMLRGLKRVDEAIAIGRDVLELRTRTLGPDHPATLRSSSNLGSYYSEIGNTEEAARLTRDSLERRMRVLGPDHPDTYNAALNLADYEIILGNPAEAVRLAEMTFDARKRLLGDEHPDTQSAGPLLARALANAGECARAIPMLETERSDPEALQDSSPRAQSMAAYYLARCYRQTGRAVQADALERDALGGITESPVADLNPPQRHVLRQIQAAGD